MITQEFIAEIKDRTWHNDHTGSVLLVAEKIKAFPEIRALQAIETLNMYQGHITPELLELRDLITKRLLGQVRERFGQQAADAIHDAL